MTRGGSCHTICKSLDFIYNWKLFVGDKVTNSLLQYHSKYNSFSLTVDMCKGKRSGIRVIQDGIDFEQVVGPSNFMVKKLEFENDDEFDDENKSFDFH